MPKAQAKNPRKKTANGYRMPEPLPKGEVLTDMTKKSWKLGKSIGKGGFGEIYEAQEASSTGSNYPYVVKIEPHENGPLFVEMNFYMRVAKKDSITEFVKDHGLKTIGMPPFIASGSHEYKNEKFRFLVMEKYGKDIWKCYIENGKQFIPQTVYKLGLQILDVLEYIHSKDYIHADIKGANILTGLSKQTENQAYLVDFGLATKFSTATEFKPDPKKAHDGTIEYLSRDAHKGVPTRRGDLEILLYNLIHWLGCKLPWENCLTDPKAVEESKNKHMDGNLLSVCFGEETPPKAIVDYLGYIKKLKFNEKPDYRKLRGILLAGLKAAGGNENTALQLTSNSSPTKRKSASRKQSPAKRLKTDKTEKKDVPAHESNNATPKKRGRKAANSKKTVSKENDPEEEDVENTDEEADESNNATPKKRGRKAANSKKRVSKENDPKEEDVENTDVQADESNNATPKKRGRKAANSKKTVTKENDPEEEDIENTEDAMEENGNEDSDSGLSTVSETAEMIRLREKIAMRNGVKKATTSKKKTEAKPKSTNKKEKSKDDLDEIKPVHSRSRRNAKVTTYKEEPLSEEDMFEDSPSKRNKKTRKVK